MLVKQLIVCEVLLIGFRNAEIRESGLGIDEFHKRDGGLSGMARACFGWLASGYPRTAGETPGPDPLGGERIGYAAQIQEQIV